MLVLCLSLDNVAELIRVQGIYTDIRTDVQTDRRAQHMVYFDIYDV